MNRMGIPQPDYTPDGALAEIARLVPFFKGAVWEKLGDNGKQWPFRKAASARGSSTIDDIEDLERETRMA